MRRLVVPLLLVAVAVPATVADARPKRSTAKAQLQRSPLLWATINVCDTPRHPNTLGIRASMPATGRQRLGLYMRFQAQYLAKADGKWHNVARDADSGFRFVGRTRRGARESGYSFSFMPPAGGGAHTLRGAVTFEWRSKRRVVYRVRELTEPGHTSRTGADPPGFSAAGCEIR